MVLLLSNICCFASSQLRVEEFRKHSKLPFIPTPGADKSGAVIQFAASEQGFEFKIADEVVPPTQSDDGVSIVAPKKTPFIEITHPAYGSLFWKIPKKKLKRKRVYSATLISDNPESEYKIQKQWAVINTSPKSAVVQVDTLISKIFDGVLQLYLPIGEYPISVISPFYEEQTDTLRLTEDGRTVNNYNLSPLYSYIEVDTSKRKKSTLSIDGVALPKGEMRSGHLLEGQHTVELTRHKYTPYREYVELERGDRKRLAVELQPSRLKDIVKSAKENDSLNRLSVELTESTLVSTKGEISIVCDTIMEYKVSLNGDVVGRFTHDCSLAGVDAGEYLMEVSAPYFHTFRDSINLQSGTTLRYDSISLERKVADVKLTAYDEDCEILVNREVIAKGEWSGTIPAGGYYIMSRRGDVESQLLYYEVSGDEAMEIKIPTPLTYYGKLNVACNVVGAKIYINGMLMGLTPMIIHNLDRDSRYDIELKKDGYVSKKKGVKLTGNAMKRVDIKLKKEDYNSK